MKVTQTIQSTDTTNAPVEIVYYQGDDLAQAIAGLVMAATDTSDKWYTVLDVRLTM